jgi:ribonucleotide monophosphatase NagD (HAD superfamily)
MSFCLFTGTCHNLKGAVVSICKGLIKLFVFFWCRFQISTSEICMVGDRLDTDILFGQNGSCRTLLVLSGVTSLDALQSPENSIQPDAYINQLSDLLSAKKSASA